MSETRAIHVRNIDAALWRRFRALCVARNLKLHEALADAIRAWMERKETQ